jgi:FkbM family methyltransferase
VPDRLKSAAIPFLRGYLRYAPVRAGKQALWERVIWPRFAWHPHSFTGARTRFGFRISGRTDEILQQYVYYFGVWEPAITRAIAERLRPGDGFVDVGANVGYHSLLASQLVGRGGSVVAVEPSPELHAALVRNVALNRARNVRTFPLAASDRSGTVGLVPGPNEHLGLTKVTALDEAAQTVKAEPLSALLSPEEFARVRLVKIDVEGAEAAVVEGMMPLLGSARRDLELLVELHGESSDDLVGSLAEAGFTGFRLENDYSPAAYLRRPAALEPEPLTRPIDFECNVLFSRRAS